VLPPAGAPRGQLQQECGGAEPLRWRQASGGSVPAYLHGIAGAPGGRRRRRAGSLMPAASTGVRCWSRAARRVDRRPGRPSACARGA